MVVNVPRMMCDKCKKEIRDGGYVKFKDHDYHIECASDEIKDFILSRMSIYVTPFNPFSPNKNLGVLLNTGGSLPVSIPKSYYEYFLNNCTNDEYKSGDKLIGLALECMVKDDPAARDLYLAEGYKLADAYEELCVMVEYFDLRIVRRVGYRETEENLGAQVWITPSIGGIQVFAGSNTKYGNPTGSSYLLSKHVSEDRSNYDIVLDILYDIAIGTDDYAIYDEAPDVTTLKVAPTGEDAPPIGTPMVSAPHDPKKGYKFDMFNGSL